jgi:hypothetical protein
VCSGAVRPGREAGHYIEFLEERADDLVGVGAAAKMVELTHDAGQCRLDIGNRVFRVIGSLLL